MGWLTGPAPRLRPYLESNPMRRATMFAITLLALNAVAPPALSVDCSSEHIPAAALPPLERELTCPEIRVEQQRITDALIKQRTAYRLACEEVSRAPSPRQPMNREEYVQRMQTAAKRIAIELGESRRLNERPEAGACLRASLLR